MTGMMGWTPPSGIGVPKQRYQRHYLMKASMEKVSIIGLDIAKSVCEQAPQEDPEASDEINRVARLWAP